MVNAVGRGTAVERIPDGEPLPAALQAQMMRSRVFSPPPDTSMAVRMFAGILTTYALLCSLWYFTGWEQGANMVLMGIVAIAFFGAGDNPGATIATFGRFATLAMALGALLSYVLLPLAGDYGSFLIVMGLFCCRSACGRRATRWRRWRSPCRSATSTFRGTMRRTIWGCIWKALPAR